MTMKQYGLFVLFAFTFPAVVILLSLYLTRDAAKGGNAPPPPPDTLVQCDAWQRAAQDERFAAYAAENRARAASCYLSVTAHRPHYANSY